MDIINQLTIAFLVLVNVGGGIRIILLFISTMSNPEEAAMSKKKIFNVIKFMIFATIASNMIMVIKKYFL